MLRWFHIFKLNQKNNLSTFESLNSDLKRDIYLNKKKSKINYYIPFQTSSNFESSGIVNQEKKLKKELDNIFTLDKRSEIHKEILADFLKYQFTLIMIKMKEHQQKLINFDKTYLLMQPINYRISLVMKAELTNLNIHVVGKVTAQNGKILSI
ncbi:hypothetical protein BpHYR1_011468 [Brachionus plicatilis]|uniref:Uncharacterized protein n=1 Tax=Brachionus plicatilis TaxID=10195 RepID=A0A3M7QF23_BRAPC|nr:hypothetical protein BpHYR1_011468 [Brachionus plicatilis]